MGRKYDRLQTSHWALCKTIGTWYQNDLKILSYIFFVIIGIHGLRQARVLNLVSAKVYSKGRC